MDTNPYESPQTDCHAPENWQDAALRVEGRYLIIPEGTVLPPVCIRTNRPVSQVDMVRKTLYWCSPWAVILGVSGGILTIPIIFLFMRRIKITYGLAPELHRKYRILRLVRSAAVIGCFTSLVLPFLAFFVPIVLYRSELIDAAPSIIVMGKVLMVAFVVGFLLMSVAILIGTGPLSLRKYRDGMFWVKGCSEEYLARIEAEGDWAHSQ